MTSNEKLDILKTLIADRADMNEHTIKTASLFLDHCDPNSGYSDMYHSKITAASAVSSFCYELLDILHTLSVKED